MQIIFDNLPYLLLGPFPRGPIGGLLLTVVLGLYTGSSALAIGVIIGSASLVPIAPVRWIARGFVMFVRGVPALVFLFWIYFLLPRLIGIDLSAFQSAAIGLAIYHGAYMAEDVRGGTLAVGRGQREAAYASSLTPFQVWRHVVLPQAIRTITPALLNRFVNLFMYTSVVALFGVLDFMRIAVLLNNRELVYPIQIFGFVGAVYFCICYGMTLLGRKLEEHWQWAPKIRSLDVAI